MKATRIEETLEIPPNELDTEFSHLEHMYTGRLSDYYYSRFDQVLNIADIEDIDRALIVGGGTGVFSLSLVQYVDDVYFSDISRERPPFSTVRSLFNHSTIDKPSIQFSVADATCLPYRSNSFDAVFVLDVLEHIPDEESAIGELSRVTRQNGQTIVSAPIEIGPPLAAREAYRFIDGGRQETESFTELCQSVLGKPLLDENQHHRGYDYRKTYEWLEEVFVDVSTEYCPYPALKWLNPTVIMNARI